MNFRSGREPWMQVGSAASGNSGRSAGPARSMRIGSGSSQLTHSAHSASSFVAAFSGSRGSRCWPGSIRPVRRPYGPGWWPPSSRPGPRRHRPRKGPHTSLRRPYQSQALPSTAATAPPKPASSNDCLAGFHLHTRSLPTDRSQQRGFIGLHGALGTPLRRRHNSRPEYPPVRLGPSRFRL